MHFLIVPKYHVATLADCGPSEQALLGKMMLLAPQLAAQFGCAYIPAPDGSAGSGGFKTQFNVGPAGGQEVYHLHLHVIGHPRT
jgi:histidine triad (HIT) family protein